MNPYDIEESQDEIDRKIERQEEEANADYGDEDFEPETI